MLPSPCESLSVCVSTWKNVVLETPGVAETNTKVVLSTLPVSVDRFCHGNRNCPNGALKLHRCVAEIQLKSRSVEGVGRQLTEFAVGLISSQSCL